MKTPLALFLPYPIDIKLLLMVRCIINLLTVFHEKKKINPTFLREHINCMTHPNFSHAIIKEYFELSKCRMSLVISSFSMSSASVFSVALYSLPLYLQYSTIHQNVLQWEKCSKISAVHYVELHVAIKHLKCGKCNWGNKYFNHILHEHVKDHMWLAAAVLVSTILESQN